MKKLGLLIGCALMLSCCGCSMSAEQAMHHQNARSLEKGRISGAEYMQERRKIDEQFRQR
jgi:hypothetical protein